MEKNEETLDNLMGQLDTIDNFTDKLNLISKIKELIEKEQEDLNYYESLLVNENSKTIKKIPKNISKYGLDECINKCNGDDNITDKMPYYIAVRDYFNWLDTNTFSKTTS